MSLYIRILCENQVKKQVGSLHLTSELKSYTRGRAERKVKTTAANFVRAIVRASHDLIAADAYAEHLTRQTGRYKAAFIVSVFGPIGEVPRTLFPKGDNSGRVVIAQQDSPNKSVAWFYERRAHALARLTASERLTFVRSVLACERLDFAVVDTAPRAFASALREMRARDAAKMAGA